MGVTVGGSIGNGALLLALAWAVSCVSKRASSSGQGSTEHTAGQISAHRPVAWVHQQVLQHLVEHAGRNSVALLQLSPCKPSEAPAGNLHAQAGRMAEVSSHDGTRIAQSPLKSTSSGPEEIEIGDISAYQSCDSGSNSEDNGSAGPSGSANSASSRTSQRSACCGAITLTTTGACTAIKSGSAWRAAVGRANPYPDAGTLVVVQSPHQEAATAFAAAAHASHVNCPRVAHAPCPLLPSGADRWRVPRISGNALAHLLHLRTFASLASTPLVIDVRRHDEVALYGTVHGARHLPVFDWLLALSAADETFAAVARFDKPQPQQLLIFFSRATARAELAALVAMSHGFKHAYACQGGAQEWRYDSDVLPYPPFGPHDPPPPPGQPSRQRVDVDRAAGELRRLGIL